MSFWTAVQLRSPPPTPFKQMDPVAKSGTQDRFICLYKLATYVDYHVLLNATHSLPFREYSLRRKRKANRRFFKQGRDCEAEGKSCSIPFSVANASESPHDSGRISLMCSPEYRQPRNMLKIKVLNVDSFCSSTCCLTELKHSFTSKMKA